MRGIALSAAMVFVLAAVPAQGAREPAGSPGFQGFERWEAWWTYNQVTYLGAGRHGDESARAERFRAEVLPALMVAVREDDGDVADSAVLAIARGLRADDAGLAFDAMVATLGHEADSARQAAVLALGVLGSEKARPILLDLMGDTRAGRKLLKSSRRVPALMRAFAALSLGMIGHPDDIDALLAVLAGRRSPGEDLGSCALLALGLFTQRQDEIIARLLEVIERSRLKARVRAFAPIALARMGSARGLPAAEKILLAAVRLPATGKDLRRSCIIALGELAGMGDGEVLAALTALIGGQRDAQARHLAFIALGRMAARDGSGFAAHAQAHAKLFAFLRAQVQSPARPTHQPWAALALGIYLREYRGEAAHDELLQGAGETLLAAFEKSENLSYQGALAIALGLIEARPAAGALVALFRKSYANTLRGYLAISLGLMGHGEAAGDFRSEILKRDIEWHFRVNLARALRLLRDRSCGAELVDLLWEVETVIDMAALAKAIGLVGDEKTVTLLVETLLDQDNPPLVRAFTAVALGLLMEKTPLPWHAALSCGQNYAARTAALGELLDIL